MKSTRRQFIEQATRAAGGAALLSCDRASLANPMNQPIGFETSSELMVHLNEDWQGTWNKMASFGYKVAGLVPFHGNSAKYTAKDILKSLTDAGLYANYAHFSYAAWTEGYATSLQYAHDLGVKTVVCDPASHITTVDDWKWIASRLNEIGARLQKDGLQLAYHNHEIEFEKIGDGQVPWDILMENTVPELVWAQLDVGNVYVGGGNVIEVLSKYKERTHSLHLKDFAPGKVSVPVGQGILDWKKILAIAASANILSYFTEMLEIGDYGMSMRSWHGKPLEPSMDVMEASRLSYIFLSKFK